MADKRVIASVIWRDDFFGSLNMLERCLWIGLFSRCADDQGRMIDSAILIKSDVFPYDDISPSEIADAITHFADEEKIIRYSVDDKSFIQLVNWWENQSPQWAMPSKYPAPPGWLDRIRSYIKGVYRCENWPTKTIPDIPQVDVPPDDATLPPQVAGHDPDPEYEINKDVSAPKPRRKTKIADPRSKHPAILMAKGVGGGKYPPLELYDDIIRIVGDSPDGIKAAACRKEWMKRGYNGNSWNWLIEWYPNGIPSRNGGPPVPVRTFYLPQISPICGNGERMKKRAESLHGTPEFDKALQEYQDHIAGCEYCGGASNASDVRTAVANLAKGMSAT